MKIWDGFDDCILGYVERDGSDPAVCYDWHGMVKKCVDQGMAYEDAIEYIESNIASEYIGHDTPFLLYYCNIDDLREMEK